MIREEIEQTKKGKLTDYKAHDKLLVSFGGIKQGLGIPVFEFFNSIADIPCDKIFLRDFHQAWYQKGVDADLNHIDKLIEDLRNTIFQRNYKSICFIGNSMGAYAAILFGSILNVDTVIAFAPQSFINRYNRFIHFDRRWNKQMAAIYRYKDKKKEYFDLKQFLSKNPSYKTKINIYYSSDYKLDSLHALRLKNNKNMSLHPIAEGGHSVVKTIRNKGKLRELIQASFIE